MSYTETTWKKGDAITAEKLNNIEGGIKANETAIGQIDTSGDDSVFIVNIDAEDNSGTITATADKTRQEMSAAVDAGKRIIIRLTHNKKYAPPSIHELTPNIWTSTNASGYTFTAEKILQIDGTSKSINTAKVDIGFYDNTDTITVSFPHISFT